MKPFKFQFCLEGEIMSEQSVTFTVTVKPSTPPPKPLTLTTSAGDNPVDPVALPDETVGVEINDPVCVVSGGTAPYNFDVPTGSIPPGTQLMSTVSADGSSEAISLQGTPTAEGSGSFVLHVTDSATPPASVKATVTRKIG
jgi:hypothetical protein